MNTVGRLLVGLATLGSCAIASQSPKPQDTMPTAIELTIPTLSGAMRGSYQGLTFGALLSDNGPNPLEEITTGDVRQWVFQAAGGTISVGGATYKATCIRATRFNVLVPSLEFYYQFRISALEGSCTEVPDKRLVELVFTMDDFIIQQYKSGSLHYFGQTTDVLLFATTLKTPERIDAVAVPAGYLLSGRLGDLPFVANLQIEVMLRPAGQASCRQTAGPAGAKPFDPEQDPYSSVFLTPDSKGKWGATVPKLGGAVCLRLTGGGWRSAISTVGLPN